MTPVETTRDNTRGMSRAEIEALLSSADLLHVGQLADAARRDRCGDRGTYVTVFEVRVDADPPRADEVPDGVQEVRLVGRPASADAAEAAVRAVKAAAGERALTGFSLVDLVALAGDSRIPLRDIAARLSSAGLESVAEVPVDALEDPVRAVADVLAGGLAAWRAVVERAPFDSRLDLIQRVNDIQAATGALRAFAPLPRVDDRDAPATGFDDVRTVAAARLMCGAIDHVQVDWPLYGPKLAQVALTYGANDIDGVRVVDTLGLGWRRAPREDVERNIRAAGQEPVLRTGRFTIP